MDTEKTIKLLENYKEMLNELEKNYGYLSHHCSGSDDTIYLKYIIPRLKEKYCLEE